MQYPTISEYVKASQDASDNLDMPTEATNAESLTTNFQDAQKKIEELKVVYKK